MRCIEKVLLAILLGAMPPLLGFLAAWWVAFAFLPESLIPPAALSGFGVGLLVDLFLLGGWVSRAYAFPWRVWMAVYLFYTLGVFGFCMGVPVFNLALVIPAGFFAGTKLARQGDTPQQVRRQARRACLFTTGVMAGVCALSAGLALSDPYTSANLEGMFHLPFQVTRAMLLGIIAGGGTALLCLAWVLTAQSIRLAERLVRVEAGRSQALPADGHGI